MTRGEATLDKTMWNTFLWGWGWTHLFFHEEGKGKTMILSPKNRVRAYRCEDCQAVTIASNT